MKKILIATTLAALMMGTAQAADKGDHKIVDAHHQYRAYLVPLNNSGIKGTITMIPDGPKKTKVIARMTGKKVNHPMPFHIHKGICRQLNPKPKYPLNPIVNGKSVTVIDVPTDSLFQQPYAFNVHESKKNMKHYVACGNMP